MKDVLAGREAPARPADARKPPLDELYDLLTRIRDECSYGRATEEKMRAVLRLATEARVAHREVVREAERLRGRGAR